MPIRADQLREKEDFQKLILERLEEDNKFRIRPNTAYKPGLAMDTEVLLEFLEDTQHDEMERLRRMYKDRTNDTVINYINSEINKESRGLIDVIKHGVEFDNGVTLRLMYRKPDSTINTQAVANYRKNIFSVMEEVYHKADERIDLVIFLNGLAMWSLLDGALKKITKRPELEQMEIKITIRRFLKGYCFLIQATAYENLEFHKRYNFLSYLIKELNPGGGGNNFDIADKITVSDFRQKQLEKHQGEEIEAKPEVKIKKPKPASLEEEQKKLLSQIIDEVNALYDKDYEPDFTTKAAMQIRDLLLKNAALKERLEKSAKNNTLNEFKFTYDDCVQDALVEGYDQNADFYTLLLNNEEIRAKFTNVFMTEIYRILREGTQTD